MNENDFTENELTEAITANLPEKPSTTGWGPQVRRRRRRQRAATGAVALVAVAALAVPLALQLGGRGQTVQTTPSPTGPVSAQSPQPPVDAYPIERFEPAACRDATGQRLEPTELTGGKLPTGATQVWLCGGSLSDAGRQALVGARDPLTVDVERAVSDFNALTWRPGAAIDCRSNGEEYQVVFEYADGTPRVVRGFNTPGGCDHFNAPKGVVEGAAGYLGQLKDLWAEQRKAALPSTPKLALCPAATSVWGLDVASVTRGFACTPLDDQAAEPLGQRPIPDDLLAAIREAFPDDPTALGQQPLIASKERVVLLNAFSDPLTLHWVTDDSGGKPAFVWYAPGLTTWAPSADLAARIQRELFSDPPGPTPTGTEAVRPQPSVAPSSADDLVPAACLPGGGTSRTTELPDLRLPAGATRVWLCGAPSLSGFDYVGAPEPLVTRVDEAVAAFNSVPLQPGVTDCEANGSIAFRVVYEYPDGSKHIVEGELGGCQNVTSASGYRGESRQFLDALRGLWRQQRTEQGTTFTGDPDRCPVHTTIMGTGFADMTRGWFCGPNGVTIPLSNDLVRDVAGELAALPDDGGTYPGITNWPPMLVLMSSAGDPLTVPGTPAGFAWYDPEPRGQRSWTPSKALAARLWAEITADGRCEAPARIVPGDVEVQVFDGGGGAANVRLLTERLVADGFKAVDSGRKRTAELGSMVEVHGPAGNNSVGLLSGQFSDTMFKEAAGAISVVVSSKFDPDRAFRSDAPKDVPAGPMTCS